MWCICYELVSPQPSSGDTKKRLSFEALVALELVVAKGLVVLGRRSVLLAGDGLVTLLLLARRLDRLAVGLDVLDEVLEGAVAVVVNPLLRAGGAELEGGVALDAEGSLGGEIVLGGVHLGDNNVRVLVALAKSVPDGGETLAVTTPGGVELGKDVLGRVANELVPAGGGELPDGAVLRLRDGLRLDGGLDVAGEGASDKLLDSGRGDLLGKDVLGLLDNVLEDEAGEVLDIDAKRLAVVAKLDGVNVDKVDLAALGLGKVSQALDDLGTASLLGGVGEDVADGDAVLGVVAKVVGAKLVKDGDRLGLDELAELFGRDVASVGDGSVVKLLVENDSGELGLAGELGKVGALELAKDERVTGRVGELLKRLGDRVLVVTVGNDDAASQFTACAVVTYTLSALVKSSWVSAESSVMAGRLCLFMYETMPSALRGPE